MYHKLARMGERKKEWKNASIYIERSTMDVQACDEKY